MHSFNSILVHCVWSTKRREPLLTSDLRGRLWPYLGGIARENKMKALAIGGAADHVHMLLSLPGTLSVAKAVQLCKGIHRSGFTKLFPKSARLNGKKGMVHLASAFPPLTLPSHISATKPNTIERALSERSCSQCCASMTSITTNGCSIDSFVPVRTRLLSTAQR